MVKKVFLTVLFLIYTILTNSCFLIYEAFVYDSNLKERLLEMNNTVFVNSLPSIKTNGGNGIDPNAAYSFLLVTDTHIKDGKADNLDMNLKNAITAHNPAFVIILGDITEGEGSDYNIYIKIAEEIALDFGIPLFPVIGNHDLIGNGWNHWKNKIGSTNYIIEDDDNNATLIILDAGQIYYGKEQLDWLEAQLKEINSRATPPRDIFVFAHVTPFSQGFYVQIDERERARIASVLRNKCDAMFGGHNHVRYTQRTGNVDYVTTASYRDDRDYCVVSVSSSGTLSYNFRKF